LIGLYIDIDLTRATFSTWQWLPTHTL